MSTGCPSRRSARCCSQARMLPRLACDGCVRLDVARGVVQDLRRQVQPERDHLAAVPADVLQCPGLHRRRPHDLRVDVAAARPGRTRTSTRQTAAPRASLRTSGTLMRTCTKRRPLRRHGRLTRVTSVTGVSNIARISSRLEAHRRIDRHVRARAAPPATAATRSPPASPSHRSTASDLLRTRIACRGCRRRTQLEKAMIETAAHRRAASRVSTIPE